MGDAGPVYTWSGLVAPSLYGTVIASLLSGICINQTVAYIADESTRSGGRFFDHCVVLACSLVLVALTAVDLWNLEEIFILHALDEAYAMIFHPSTFSIPLIAACGSLVSQLWFLERAWRSLGRNQIFLAITLIPILCSFAGGVGIFVVGRLPDGGWQWLKLERLCVIWMWSTAISDTIITAVLCWRVRSVRRMDARNQLKSNRVNPFRDVLRLSFATGALTSISALLAGAIYLATWTNSDLFVSFYLCIPRFSILSVLITLNHRRKWRTLIEGSDSSANGVFAVRADVEGKTDPLNGGLRDGERPTGLSNKVVHGGRPLYSLKWKSNHETSPLVRTGQTEEFPEMQEDDRAMSPISFGLRLSPDSGKNPTPVLERFKGTWEPYETEITSLGDLERALCFYQLEDKARGTHRFWGDEEGKDRGERKDHEEGNEPKTGKYRGEFDMVQQTAQSTEGHSTYTTPPQLTNKNFVTVPLSSFRRSSLLRHGREGSYASGISVVVETTTEEEVIKKMD